MRRASSAAAIGGGVAALLLPWLDRLTGQSYFVDIGCRAGLYMLLVLGLQWVIGFAGLLDLGFAAFYAIGAYAAALLSIHFGWTLWLTLPSAMVAAAAMRFLLGGPVLRLRGDYLAIATLGFGEIVRITLNNWDSLTNGPKGLPGAGQAIQAEVPLGPLSFSLDTGYYFLILAMVAGAILITIRCRDSRIGRAWRAIREDETAAELSGVEVARQRLLCFTLSGAFAGAAGAIFAHWQGFVSPESFTFWESVFLVSAVVLGGIGSVSGAILGALFLTAAPEILRELGPRFVDVRYLLFGVAMILVVIRRPQGLLPPRPRTYA